MAAKSPADMLADTARLLYGPHWRKPLAEALEIDETTIRKFMSGKIELTADHGLFADLKRILSDQAYDMQVAVDDLSEWLAANESRD